MSIPYPIESLKKNVDPQIESINPEEMFPKDLIISDFAEEVLNEPIQQEQSGRIPIYSAVARGSALFGDTWGYKSDEIGHELGYVKAKKGTVMIELTEDQLSRIRANDSYFIREAITNQMKIAARSTAVQMEKMAFTLSPNDPGYDAAWISPLAPSNSGTNPGNPADCNATPGTAKDLSAIIWSGGSQTTRNIETFLAAIEADFAAIRALDTQFTLNFKNKILVVPPAFYAVLKTTKDIKSTTQVSNLYYIEELAAAGYQVRESPFVDPSYTALSSNTACSCVVYADPMNSFAKVMIPCDGGYGWTDWAELKTKDNGIMKISYEKHKKFEWFLLARAYYLPTSENSAVRWRKPVYWLTTKPYKT